MKPKQGLLNEIEFAPKFNRIEGSRTQWSQMESNVKLILERVSRKNRRLQTNPAFRESKPIRHFEQANRHFKQSNQLDSSRRRQTNPTNLVLTAHYTKPIHLANTSPLARSPLVWRVFFSILVLSSIKCIY